ncbi:phytoene desaturase family protein [Lederbergia wuyishanensis]|uniref:Phytoene dehydrogenase-like protein n=1 Tax=Lederbergia wuyishanensis TaxID=1347903 RepID=A0ABU0D5T5_9BACI|nr:FAD-dependent oxidoreductase [Lederbergia wuyishanensis]MCJ8008345.1 FAD-dependent oxidoreductase [Lederbergia wuyishanensis]MDQ0343756.1 phytoene dehydrogenase-like protein [Lederbergia wuyishanensis]
MFKYDVAVVGGGLAGLTAANFLAREGKKVIVLEKSNRLGGRAMTNNKNGVLMNLGPHGLYISGDAMTILTELGLTIPGGNASKSVEIHGILNHSVQVIPTDFTSIMSSSLLSWKSKFVFGKLMLKLMKLNVNSISEVSLKEWADAEISDPMVRHIFYSICRLTTYTNSPTLQLAKPVLNQVQRSLKGGVLYVDGGWETIIQKLKQQAVASGVEIFSNKNVTNIEHHEDYQSILCSDGTVLDVADCIVAAPPKEAMKMIKGAEQTTLHQWNENTIPVTASCIDLGLKKLPNPQHQFAIGLDQSLFFTNQSRAAKLSEDGTLVVSLVKYHNPIEEINLHADKQQLESVMDLLHPGWRQEVVVQQFLPKLTVFHDFPHVNRKGNPGPIIPEMSGIYIAGDWAGHEEVLADAAVASGKRAALEILKANEMIFVKEG